jgi:protein transport protein SEC13
MRFVSGGSDNLVKVWTYNEFYQKFEDEILPEMHKDWVRDVAWSHSLTLPCDMIASASEVNKF